MMVQFKLIKTNGLTRRITFATRPTWSILSDRISNLYDIAIEHVAVSYIDCDGDEVTLSSGAELQDFYTSASFSDTDAIKLAVHDLSSIRTANTASPSFPSATPPQSHFRNTFGGHEVLPLVFDPEDEWRRLPGSLGGLFLSRDAPESPHAFVEVLESDVSVSKSEAAESGGGNTSYSDLTFTPTALQNKGKGKGKGKGRAATVEDDISSAGSVIGDEAPAKPPVHVFDMSSEDIFGLSPRSTVQLPRSGATTPAQAQSTPVIAEQPLKVNASVSAGEQRTETLDDDPPLPSLDLPDPHRTPPSLAHDVATLLTTISTVISTHPELSERLRNIVVNATNGTYWAAHRDAISRAAENIHRTAVQGTGRSFEELRRAAEQEAGARVTEALGRIFCTVGDFAQDAQRNTGPQASRNTTLDETITDIPRSPGVVPIPPIHPHLPLHPRRNHHSWFSQPPFGHPGGSPWGGLVHPPFPPPPPPPPPPPFRPRGWPRPPPPRFWGRDSEHPDSPVNTRDARAAAAEILATAAEARARSAEERAEATATRASLVVEATPEELRTEVERAKADYKTRKERYRQAKAIRRMAEQRRRDQESTTESLSRQTSDNPVQATPVQNGHNIVPATPTAEQATESCAAASDIHIVSNARGPYPQLEMFSVPRRSRTTVHMHRGIYEDKENRPLNRIMRKLSDMGFTEGTYPNLTGKVKDQLLSRPPVTKDAEDDVVTTLIEELLSSGGSAHVGGGIPGAWN